MKLSWRKKISLVGLGILLSFVFIEISMRSMGMAVKLVQECKNIISFNRKADYRILCLGESTTASSSSKYHYPGQMEKILNRECEIKNISVINKGLPGADTGVILSMTKTYIDEYRPDMIIAMMGINDNAGTTTFYDEDGFRGNRSELKIKKLFKHIILNIRIALRAGLIKKHVLNSKKRTIDKSEIEDADSITDLAISYINSGRYRKAEELLKEGLRENPGQEDLFLALGHCYMITGKLDEYKIILKRALEINPMNHEAYRKLGYQYGLENNHVESVGMLKKAISIDPLDFHAYLNLSLQFIKKGAYDTAIKVLREYVKLDRENDRIYGMLGVLLLMENDLKRSSKYFEKAKRLRLRRLLKVTAHNYRMLKKISLEKNIRIVFAQYPIRDIEVLKGVFHSNEGVIFVDNEDIFKSAVRKNGYLFYFIDAFGGDFGHCTPKGNSLLALNISKAILKEIVDSD